MPLPGLSDYDKKRIAGLKARATTPQGGQIPEIDRNVTEVGTGQILVTTTPQQISFVARNKISTKLTNLGSTEVWWGTTSGVSPLTGDLLAAGRGSWVSIVGGCVIWVVTAAGTQQISWAEAYEEE